MGSSLRKATVADLERISFAPRPLFESLIADDDGKPAARLAANKEKTR
jgi:hypothetical protein